jgi:crotonobetainyl-CoA:carnitine CoA-transferase CaiB-like acyl-CoA transferase
MEPWLWSNFCDAVHLPELKQHQMHRSDFHQEASEEQKGAREKLATLFKTRTSKEWQLFFREKDVCVGEVNDVQDALKDPQLLERGMVTAEEFSGVENSKQPGIAIKLSETPGAIRSRPPKLGEHNQEILSSLGFAGNQIRKWADNGVI